MKRVAIEISRRHVHLTIWDYERLFGRPCVLCVRNTLSQPDQFASTDTVTARARGRVIEHIRVVGPYRGQSQLELAASDAHALDIHPPRRLSGDVEGAETVELFGPAGSVAVPAIIAWRHLHCDTDTAIMWNLASADRVKVGIDNGRYIDDIVVRVAAQGRPAVHVDEDEAKEFGLGKREWGIIV